MRLLILSEGIKREQGYREPRYSPPYDIHLDVGDLNQVNDRSGSFDFSTFDYDVAIVHISTPPYHSIGYYENLEKLLRDCQVSLEHGRTIICLPESQNFRPARANNFGTPVYEWVRQLGIELQDSKGQNIKPSGAGRADVIQNYLKSAPNYYQIVIAPETEPRQRLAVVADTNIVV